MDEAGLPIGWANVQLVRAADSSFVKGAVADDAGRFVLTAVAPGTYRLLVSLIGYRDNLTAPIHIDADEQHDVGVIRLAQDILQMGEVSVEARRTLYEQKGDRLVINVGTSIGLVSGSALDILKRAPGIIVNEQAGAISMLGKNGVRVMIDGKLRYAEDEALTSFLAGLSADNVESIELITSPPAELDAEGNAGFINIVLKRSRGEGLNGSVSASTGYGFRKGELISGSTNVFFRRDRIRVYGSYSLVWNGQEQVLNTYRRVTGEDRVLELPAFSRRDPTSRVHNVSVGADYDVGERTSVSALLAGYQDKFRMEARTDLAVTADGAPITISRNDIDMFNRWRHVMGSVSVQHKPRPGTSVGAEVDYLRYHNEMPTDNVNTSTALESGGVTELILSSMKETPLAIAVAKADYQSRVGDRFEVGIGTKAALSRFTNRMSFSESARRDWMSEEGLSTRSVLREDVLAIYGKAAYRWSAADAIELGLRFEHTDTEMDTREIDGLVERRWGRFFPSVTYTLQMDPDARLSLSYVRRVTRPAFNDLASFSRFDDPYQLFTGNAALQAAVTDAVKLHLSYRSFFGSIEYAREDSSIARFQSRLVPGEDVQVVFPTNLNHTQSLNALVGVPLSVTGWWSLQNDLMLSRQHVDGEMNGRPVKMNHTFYRLNTTQNLSLPFDLNFEANGFYQSATLLGSIRWEPTWGVNLALQRQLPAGNGALTFSVDDVFDSIEWTWISGRESDPLSSKWLIDMSHRTFKVTYSRRFGEGDARQGRVAASEAESSRVE